MKKIITYGALLLMFCGSGCATSIQINNNNGFHSTGAQQYQHVNRWAWGIWNGSVNKPDCPNGLHTITVTTTFGETLLTIVTLGIYCPVDVTWLCEQKNLSH